MFDPGLGTFYEQLLLLWLDPNGLQDPSMGFFADTDRVVTSGGTGAGAGRAVSPWAGQQPSSHQYFVEATAPTQVSEPNTLSLLMLALLAANLHSQRRTKTAARAGAA